MSGIKVLDDLMKAKVSLVNDRMVSHHYKKKEQTKLLTEETQLSHDLLKLRDEVDNL